MVCKHTLRNLINRLSAYIQGRRKHLKTSPAMGVVNRSGIELIVFKHARVNVNKIDHTHGVRCVLMNIKILQKTGPAMA